MAIAENGMTDELDMQAAAFIEKTRKTVRKMNERRSPVTQLFDNIRKEFTALENSIDPTKSETVAYKLQAYRDAYAAKKRAEEEERRRQELARLQAEAARRQYAMNVEDDLKAQLDWAINSTKQALEDLNESVTLDNYDSVYDCIKKYATDLPKSWGENLFPKVRRPISIPAEEAKQIEREAKERLVQGFNKRYKLEITETKTYILDRLPSRKANLERIAKANAEEAERLKKEMEARQKAEQEERQREEERRKEEERQRQELEQAQAEMADLFEQSAAQPTYQPGAKVTQKIEVLAPEGFAAIFVMWWKKEGCNLSVEELSKVLKKQLTFCEKVANKEGEFIEDANVKYVENIKAK